MAGDALTGVQSAIHAVAGGKRTALAVDAWLRGTDLAFLEQELATYSALPYLKQLKREPTTWVPWARGWPSATRCGSRWARAPTRPLARPCPRRPRPSGSPAWTKRSS